LKQYDVIVDATDNLQARYIINDSCVILNKPMVHGSIYKYEGMITVFNHKGGASLTSDMPLGSSELYNSFFGLGLGDNYGYGYGGPEPPAGTTHTYVFTVYALSEALPDQSARQTPLSEAEFLALIEGKILAKAQLTGTFKR
jgi:phosphatidylethanolamine-binding protein (PEBP) family uncharacterized protein